MSDQIRIPVEIELEYWGSNDGERTTRISMPVAPRHSDELLIALRSDETEDDPRRPLTQDRPQVHFAGTPRALEEFGRYLIALARLPSNDSDLHEHFEGVQNDEGGTVHLIVRRLKPSSG